MLSPIWFFGKVEKFLFQAPDSEETQHYVTFITPDCILPSEDTMEQVSRDAHVLNNLNHMIRISKKKDVKNMWKIKKMEFERKMRWENSIRRSHV